MLEAIGAYSESIRLEPGDGATLLALGRLRARLGDQGEADLLFSAAARHADTAADALSERAHLRRAQGREAEALADLAAAVELEAGGAGHAEELAAWYVARRAWLPALALYRRAQPADLRMGPDRRARLQIRALGVLAAELDPVLAGRARGYSWTRRLLARLATR
jgi:tetratricopeptide (TPR) repeat protein